MTVKTKRVRGGVRKKPAKTAPAPAAEPSPLEPDSAGAGVATAGDGKAAPVPGKPISAPPTQPLAGDARQAQSQPAGQPEKQQKVSLSPSECIDLYRQQEYDKLAELFLKLLLHFRDNTYRGLDMKMQHFVNVFVKNFLFYMSQEDFVPRDRLLTRFIELNPTICNLVAMSEFRTTDVYLEILANQKRNFAKILALYNPRNRTRIDRKRLFDTNPTLSSLWYYTFLESYKSGCVAENSWHHMREHLDYLDKRLWSVNGFVHHGYFGVTYIDFEKDHTLKRRVNQSFQQWAPARQKIVNKPNPKKIGIFTSMWFPRQSVYRCMYKFLEALAEDHELTLIHLGPERKDLDPDLFRGGVRYFNIAKAPLNMQAFQRNDFMMAFFPDIGMNIESIFLSNLRIAPVQVCGYGHPVSNFGSKIDYWLGGIDTEFQDAAEENYEERLVLIPGAGVMPNKPDYRFRGNYQAVDHLRINCGWTGQKINFPRLKLLRRIIDASSKSMRFRFFPGGAVHANGYVPLRREVAEVLGPENCDMLRDLQYDDYMAAMENAEFSIDSYPFGGYATATDALYLRKPIITQEGRKFYNRSASSLLRPCGLEELIAKDEEEYFEKILHMIENDGYRKSITRKIEEIDLDKTIFNYDNSAHFKRAMIHLMENDDELRRDKSCTPMIFD